MLVRRTAAICRKRAKQSNADGLSRRPLSAEKDSVIVDTLLLSKPTRHRWRNTQSTDPDRALKRFLASSYKPTAEEMNSSSKAARRIWRRCSKLSLKDEVLWYQEDATSPKRLVVPGSLIQTVLQQLHKQLEASSKRYCQSSLTPDMLDICQTCITCSGFKKPRFTAIAPLQPMPTGLSGERAGIDIMCPPPLSKRETAISRGGINIKRWICQYRVPESVHSDQCPNFEYRLYIELCKIFGIAKTRTTPGHPQGNKQVGRTNRT
uniref:Integrase catalytic domain-containing protein n=1 Tax=Taenia asiatica TaxID=60517 RepID=A0A0R3VVB0_TAEAS